MDLYGYDQLSDEDLAAEIVELAAQRTAIRERQVAAQAVRDARAAIAALPVSAQRIVRISIDGDLDAGGVAGQERAS